MGNNLFSKVVEFVRYFWIEFFLIYLRFVRFEVYSCFGFLLGFYLEEIRQVYIFEVIKNLYMEFSQFLELYDNMC